MNVQQRSRDHRRRMRGTPASYTFQPDGTVGYDTVISEAVPDGVGDTATTIGTRSGTAGQRRCLLIKFTELSTIPGSFVVATATLTLYNNGAPVADYNIACHRVLPAAGAWIEACSWNYLNPTTVRWPGDAGADGGSDAGCSIAGTDHSSVQMGTGLLPNGSPAGTACPMTLNVSEMQTMLAANYGFYVLGVGTNALLSWRSSDGANAATRPKLALTGIIY